jgi:hypothetical protein
MISMRQKKNVEFKEKKINWRLNNKEKKKITIKNITQIIKMK